MAEYCRYLGPVPHPAVGVRMPKIFLPGILSAYKLRRTVGGVMLSCTRESAPQRIIDAPFGQYPVSLGHTGVSIKEYMSECTEAARKTRTAVQIEADHLIVGSYVQAVQRILGGRAAARMSENQIAESVALVKEAIDEATATGYVNSFTMDTTSLVDVEAGGYTQDDLVARFRNSFPDGSGMLREYSRTFHFPWVDGQVYEVAFNEEETMRMALQFNRSIRTSFEIYEHIKVKMNGRPFGFEITLDELPNLTGKELAYYLNEWRMLGAHADFAAPNLGFKKRADFDGDRKTLAERASFLAAIANGYGTLLSIHSGSGESPYGGKGKGVYQAIVAAARGRVKYKISGVYFELLMDLLAKSKRSRHRALFARIFDQVLTFLQDEVKNKTAFADEALTEKLQNYRDSTKGHSKRDSRAELFRHYSFTALALRDADGKRFLKDELVSLYMSDRSFRKLVDREVKALTLRLIDGLHFAGNLS